LALWHSLRRHSNTSPKEKKEKAPAAPAQPKAEKKPKKEEVDDDYDDKPYDEAPKKNSLDLLPKSTLNPEDWKRAYSNKDTRGADGSLEWLYQKFVSPCSFQSWVVDCVHAALTRKATHFGVWISSTTRSSRRRPCPRIRSVAFSTGLKASRKYLFGSVGVLGTRARSFHAGSRKSDWSPRLLVTGKVTCI
jgi:elongation factor 1-gamma